MDGYSTFYGAGNNNKVDKWFNADSSSIKKLKKKVEKHRLAISKIPNLNDTIKKSLQLVLELLQLPILAQIILLRL